MEERAVKWSRVPLERGERRAFRPDTPARCRWPLIWPFREGVWSTKMRCLGLDREDDERKKRAGERGAEKRERARWSLGAQAQGRSRERASAGRQYL